MEAIILAGGLGTRLKNVLPDLPKPMAPIAGRPFLEILLSTLARKGFSRIVLSLGFMADKIIDHFGENYEGMKLVYEVEKVPLGTGGAICAALRRCVDDHVFVFNGDTYVDLEVNQLESHWLRNRKPIVVVREVRDTARFGRVEIVNGKIISFLEKGLSGVGFINAGCYVLSRSALDDFPLGKNFSFEEEYLSKQITHTLLCGFVTRGFFIDIGIPEDYARAQFDLSGL
jgi:D-glycero-alpha-D-manno-heptose 1-phosphate guanylyltransferase